MAFIASDYRKRGVSLLPFTLFSFIWNIRFVESAKPTPTIDFCLRL